MLGFENSLPTLSRRVLSVASGATCERIRGLLAETGAHPHEVILVGDTRADQDVARETGVFFLGYCPDPNSAPWPAARCLLSIEDLEGEVSRFDRAVPVSVAVCTYNGLSRGFLHESLDSILGQTVYPEEVLLVDDGSTDGTSEWVSVHYPRVRVLRQANRGLAEARNTAIQATSCRYLAFLDDDDRWHPEKLERQLHAGGSAVFTGLTLIDGSGRRIGERRPLAGELGWPEILLGNQVTGPSSVLMERSVVRAVGQFRSGLAGTEDYDYWIRCARVAPLRAIEQPLVEYRCHDGQMSAGYAAMAEKALEVVEAHAAPGGEAFRAQVLRYNAYGVLFMGLGRRIPEAVRLGWRWSRRASLSLALLGLRLTGMALSGWPEGQRRFRRWERATVGRQLRRLEKTP